MIKFHFVQNFQCNRILFLPYHVLVSKRANMSFVKVCTLNTLLLIIFKNIQTLFKCHQRWLLVCFDNQRKYIEFDLRILFFVMFFIEVSDFIKSTSRSWNYFWMEGFGTISWHFTTIYLKVEVHEEYFFYWLKVGKHIASSNCWYKFINKLIRKYN